jgi:hypothetical protein
VIRRSRCIRASARTSLFGALVAAVPVFAIAPASLVAHATTATTASVLQDGNFEAPVPQSFWAEGHSANAPYALIDSYNPNKNVSSGSQQSADLCGADNCVDQLSQVFTDPGQVTQATLTYWYGISSTEPNNNSACHDHLQVGLGQNNGLNSAVMQTLCSVTQYTSATLDVTSYLQGRGGQPVDVILVGASDNLNESEFFVDDITLNITYLTTPSAPLNVYHAVTPFRIADTRSNSGQPLDGQPVGVDQSATVPVAGVDGVPADAVAAVLNVATTNGTEPSFLTAYPAGSSRPGTANLNFVAGQTVANLVTVPLGTGGAVAIYNHAGTTDIVVDLEGYMEPGTGPAGLLNPLSPSRIADTRPGSGEPNQGQTVAGGTSVVVQVDGVGNVPATGVSAVVLNVTAADGTLPGFLTAFPDGGTRPLAANLNYNAGQVVPNRVIVPVGSDGKVDIYTNVGSVDVIVDVGGWFTDSSNASAIGARFTPLVPTRVADTRPGSGQALDGRTLGPGGTVSVPIASTATSPALLPTGVVAVAGNVTVANTTDSSFLTVYPDGTTLPLAADLNWVPGQIVPNLVVARLGADGALAVYNHTGNVDVIVDLFGYWS